MYIETQRLILKEYRKEDTAEYFNLTSCKQVWQYSTFTPLSDIAKSEQQLTEIIPVSYTHLDVYKRQVHTNPADALDGLVHGEVLLKVHIFHRHNAAG